MQVVGDEMWALLRALDDPVHWETPDGFDFVATRRRFDALVRRLDEAFGTACPADRQVQDASFHALVIVPGEATATGDQVVVRVSNFGNLAVVSLENPGVHDRAEFEALVDPDDLSLLHSCLDAEGYVVIPEEPLWTRYDGSAAGTMSPRNRPSWWIRFFDYL